MDSGIDLDRTGVGVDCARGGGRGGYAAARRSISATRCRLLRGRTYAKVLRPRVRANDGRVHGHGFALAIFNVFDGVRERALVVGHVSFVLRRLFHNLAVFGEHYVSSHVAKFDGVH